MDEVGLSAELCRQMALNITVVNMQLIEMETLLCLYDLSSNSMAAIFRSKAYEISIVSSSAAARPRAVAYGAIHSSSLISQS